MGTSPGSTSGATGHDWALFTWDGPARSVDDDDRARYTEAQADQEHRSTWFTEHVLSGPLRVGAVLPLSRVHALDEESGAVTVSFGRSSVLVYRRPRSTGKWAPDAPSAQRWSTGRWDRAVYVPAGTLSPDALDDPRDQLPDQ